MFDVFDQSGFVQFSKLFVFCFETQQFHQFSKLFVLNSAQTLLLPKHPIGQFSKTLFAFLSFAFTLEFRSCLLNSDFGNSMKDGKSQKIWEGVPPVKY